MRANSFTFTEPIRESDLFYGREAIRADVANRLRSTVFIGEARIGKTSLLLQLKNDLSGKTFQGDPILPFYFNLRSPIFQNPQDVCHYIGRQLWNSLGSQKKEIPEPTNVTTAESMIAFFQQIDPAILACRPVALIDNLDQPHAFMRSRLELYSVLRQLIDYSPENHFRIISTASSLFLTLETSLLSKLLSRLAPVYLGKLSEQEAATLAATAVPIATSTRSAEIIQYLYEQSGGHPCLLQEILANTQSRHQGSGNYYQCLEKVCEELSERGGSFFHQYISELGLEEVLHLLAIILRDPRETWAIPPRSLSRFQSAGLVTESVSDRKVGPTCRLFFKWLQKNVATLLPSVSQRNREVRDEEDLVNFLQKKLRAAVGKRPLGSEAHLQQVVQAMFVAADIRFVREAKIICNEKYYLVDFGILDLGVALELKLVKRTADIAKMIDQLEVDESAYRTQYRVFIALIYDLTGNVRIEDYADKARSPFARFIIIHHGGGHEG